MKEHGVSVDDDLNEGARQVEVWLPLIFLLLFKLSSNLCISLAVVDFEDYFIQEEMKLQPERLDPEFLQHHANLDREADFANALQNGKTSPSGLISVKSNKSSISARETNGRMPMSPSQDRTKKESPDW